ncbi:hypothetical protein HOH87_08075 [bacterium]|nr:hypothetical protein [bacterium]
MIKHLVVFGFVVTLLSGSVVAATVSDVPVTDPAYQAVKQSVDQGYLPLFQGSRFLPDQAVSRKELAVVMDKLIAAENARDLDLTDSEKKELARLAKSFKAYLAKQDNAAGAVQGQVTGIAKEQKVLHYDMTKVTDEMTMITTEQEAQKNLTWVAIGLGVLGLLL